MSLMENVFCCIRKYISYQASFIDLFKTKQGFKCNMNNTILINFDLIRNDVSPVVFRRSSFKCALNVSYVFFLTVKCFSKDRF